MSSIEEKQQEVVEEFAFFDDWMSKYEYIIDLGKNLPVIDEDKKTEDYRIKGCQSQVWLDASLNDEGLVDFKADSDAVITKGIISLLIRVLSGHKPQDITKADLHFIEEIGLREHLSPTRSNGLLSMVKKMKTYGLAFDHQTK
ncbi:MAG TPA: SufE family protein [Saprospiraceae bacterium]|nr:SufE family protein [Saprospiraceae bacterium]